MLIRRTNNLVVLIMIAALTVMIDLSPTFAIATDADTYGDISQATIDAFVGKTGVYGANAGVQFSDDSRWFGTSGVTGPASSDGGGRPLTIEDRFHIGSQTKTYVGTVILQDVDAGVLSLDQTIEDWLPDLTVMSKSMREQITIRDLITQRSGIPEYLNAPDPINPSQTVLDSFNAANGRYDLTPSQLIGTALTLEQTMTPGDTRTFSYSNSNFLLLGLIAEKASCTNSSGCLSFDQILQQKILIPLGLAETTYPTGTTYDGPHTDATWNEYGVLTDFTNLSPSIPNTAGAMISTVPNQLDWLIELTTNANNSLSPATFEERLSLTTDLNGYVGDAFSGYGMAIYGSTSPTTGQQILGHGGEISGLQTLMFQFPDSNLFIVGDVNTFLSVPNDRTLPANSIEELYYGLERSIMTMTAAIVNGGSCAGGDSPTCTGTTVTSVGLAATGTVNIEASGNFWTNTALNFLEPVPTVTVYGAHITALTVTDGNILVKNNAILESIGNDSTALLFNGTANTVDISGELSATGYDATAIDGSANSNDTVVIQPTGAISGNIKLTGGADKITANGTVDGDITLGTNSILDGSGTIHGMITGGIVAPGNSIGTLTVDTYNGTEGTLQMEFDGVSATGDKLKVEQQVASGFPVVDTGTVLLNGTTLELSGTRPAENTRLVLIEADQGISGTFNSITDNNALVAQKGRVSSHVLAGPESVVATWTNPAPFDAAADMNYLSSIDRVDQTLNRISNTNRALIQKSGATPFVTILGTTANFDSADSVSGYAIQTAGILTGLDIPINPDFFVGFDIASTTTTADVKGGGRDQDGLINSVGLYGEINVGAYNIGTDLSVGFGKIDYSNQVSIDGISNIATGKYDHTLFTFGLNLKRIFKQRAWDVGLAGNLVYMRGEDEGFSESGIKENAAFTYEGRTYERLRAGALATFFRNEPIEQFHPWLSLGIYQHFDINKADLNYHLANDDMMVSLEGRDASGLEGRFGIGFRRQLAGNTEMDFSVDGGIRDDNVSARLMLSLSIPLGYTKK